MIRPLIEGNEFYEIETTQGEAWVDFEVREREGDVWGTYLRGSVKWDGCSHLHFGDCDGYIHMCGKDSFDSHIEILKAVWNICTKDWNNLSREIGGELY